MAVLNHNLHDASFVANRIYSNISISLQLAAQHYPDAPESCKLDATVSHAPGHQLYSRRNFFLLEATQNISAFNCISEKTQSKSAAALPS